MSGLAMGRALQRAAIKHGDKRLERAGKDLEERATEALRKGLPEVPPPKD
jgi:hypothetical protein